MSANILKLSNYRNGVWVESKSKNWLGVLNTATSEVVSKVPLSSSKEVDEIVQTTTNAFHDWRRSPVTSRIQYLFKLKALLEENLEETARLLQPKNLKSTLNHSI